MISVRCCNLAANTQTSTAVAGNSKLTMFYHQLFYSRALLISWEIYYHDQNNMFLNQLHFVIVLFSVNFIYGYSDVSMIMEM